MIVSNLVTIKWQWYHTRVISFNFSLLVHIINRLPLAYEINKIASAGMAVICVTKLYDIVTKLYTPFYYCRYNLVM